jgi:hypothetical protein
MAVVDEGAAVFAGAWRWRKRGNFNREVEEVKEVLRFW